MSEDEVKVVAEAVSKLLGEAIEKIAKCTGGHFEGDGSMREAIFPEGLSLVYLNLNAGPGVDISLILASKGAACTIGFPIDEATRQLNPNERGGWVSSG